MLVSFPANQVKNLRKTYLCNIWHYLCEPALSHLSIAQVLLTLHYRTDILAPFTSTNT